MPPGHRVRVAPAAGPAEREPEVRAWSEFTRAPSRAELAGDGADDGAEVAAWRAFGRPATAFTVVTDHAPGNLATVPTRHAPSAARRPVPADFKPHPALATPRLPVLAWFLGTMAAAQAAARARGGLVGFVDAVLRGFGQVCLRSTSLILFTHSFFKKK